jgi:hypothetical protein
MYVSISNKDWLAAGSIFLLALLVFWFSPVHQLTDSNYSMLLSQSLLKHRTFALDNYQIPRLPPRYHDNTFKNGEIYQLELVGPHLYYYFPPGSSVLSLPYVAVMNLLGINAAKSDGAYDPDGEETIETTLAAILMAGLAAIFFLTARLALPWNWSVIVALAATFGTQIWSTASRALWTDTWAIFLLGIVIWMLLAHETKRSRLHPIVLATLLAWCYFVRPTNVISIAAITVYVFSSHRRRFVSYAITGALWFAGFVIYSWYNFHQPLPKYFLLNRLSFRSFFPAFVGNLLSPSRGLLVFVPVLLFVAYLLIRYRKLLRFPRLTLTALSVVPVHLIVIAGFVPWNGGFSYGPRYTTGLVPWFALLGIIAIRAMLDARIASPKKQSLAWRVQLTAGALLLIISIILNARGAVSEATWTWNKWPTNVDNVPAKIWDWRRPQFLAGLLHPPLPGEFPLLEGKINFASSDADKYLWYGWSWPEAESRWSDGDEAAVVFSLNQIDDSDLEIKMGPFLAPSLNQQTVDVFLNNRLASHLVLQDEPVRVYSIALSKNVLKNRNVLTFKFANAASPKSLRISSDLRELAIRVEWIQLQPKNKT